MLSSVFQISLLALAAMLFIEGIDYSTAQTPNEVTFSQHRHTVAAQIRFVKQALKVALGRFGVEDLLCVGLSLVGIGVHTLRDGILF